MKDRAASLAAAVLLGLIPVACQAQDFSTDVVYADSAKPTAPSIGATSSHSPSKVYVSKDKMRLETRGFSGTILLVDTAEHTAVALFPARKEYQHLIAGPSEYFRAQDAENACPDWQKAGEQTIKCEQVGPEVVDGRQTVKYQNKGAAGNSAIAGVWVDPALHFVIKWEDADAGAELHNIKEGQQPADLFTISTGYEVLKPLKKAPKGPSPRPR
ncbi:MAG TPA: hypothetical protein VEV41_08845 [Terriglobales bacterium]|nr:hypothetical protein [Terriglobales bacterium]